MLRPAAAALGLSVVLSACATFSPDAGMDSVAVAARTDLGKDTVKIVDEPTALRASERVRALLKKTLTPDSAVQVALLNHRGLQAAYNELGISEAQFVQASLPPAPRLSLARLAGSGIVEIERQLLVNLLALLTLEPRKEVAGIRYRQAQLKAIEETLRVAAEARRSYYRAVGSRQIVGFLGEASTAARTASELFKKLGETGAVNRLDQAREHTFYAEIAAQLGKARLEHIADRERLVRALGLWGTQVDFRLPGQLPPLPGAPAARPLIEKEAVARRVDLEIHRREVEATAASLGLTNATRYVTGFELSGLAMSEREKVFDPATGTTEVEKRRLRGIELELQIPIYDFGESKVREARETYLKAVNRLVERAVVVRSEAREAYARYRGVHQITRHYQTQILPLRKIIADESLLRYNAMLVDILPILTEARQRIAANISAIESRRDFWLAHVDLRTAVIGGGAGGGGEAGKSLAPAGGGGGEEH